MQLIYGIPYFAPAWGYGGPPRLAYDMARQMVRRGHRVRVLTTDALDGLARAHPEREVLDGIEIERVRNVSNRLAWDSKVFLPLHFRNVLVRSLTERGVIHL